MNPKTIIPKIAEHVRVQLAGEGSGHDWWHVQRVWNMARHIGVQEKANMDVVELAALLHDIADWKFHNGDDTVGPQRARQIMQSHDVPPGIADPVCEIIATLSYKGAGVATPMRTIEGKVVQDADRLDALGAIGIARVFAYGGFVKQPLHDPNLKPVMHASKEAYIQNRGTSINHFYEKLLLLKDRMNTHTGRAIAEKRHHFMQGYLDHFFQEWEGEL